ncbi:uncharacterized protein LOC124414914 [Diprion similis]|uniref:uncharacterized protein LOC124414914 n=1 Tax=Diprion similis TaxID=362088 RepID=UPI001EF8A27C|nr:uncharacterized protein LOC124414914 [Diprion similis]
MWYGMKNHRMNYSMNYQWGGAQLDQDSSMLQNLHRDMINGLPMDDMPNRVMPSENVINGLKSRNSYEDYSPAMSSTITESTIMNTLKDGLEGEDIGNVKFTEVYLLETSFCPTTIYESIFISNLNGIDDDRDEDYELSEESEKSDIISEVELSNVSTSTQTEANNTSISNISVRKRSAPDDTYMRVATSATASYTKEQFCFYCKTMQSKLARHLEQRHANEENVKKFVALPKRNSARQFNDRSLLVCRRPNEKMNKIAQDFMACAKCKGQYARSVIRHHWRKCTKRVGNADRVVMVKGRAVMGHFHVKANDLVSTFVFPYSREDEVVRTIRYDELLVLYANKQADQHGTQHHAYQMVRARLRLLGRLLIAMKNLDSEITDFASIFNPRCYDKCIIAAKHVAQFDKRTRTFKHPAVASHIGALLMHVGEVLRSECIKSENEMKQKRFEDFLKLMSENYGTAINRAVADTQMQNNRRKKVILPTIDDIKRLRRYLKIERENYMETLLNKFSSAAWLKLAEVTLISLQISNRRRAGEIERIYIEDFESHQSINASADKEVFNSLLKDAQNLAKKYVRFMIRGKCGRKVPVLVPCDLESMNLIQKFRSQAKVTDQNPYFFGLPSIDPNRYKYLRACDLLRNFSVACGAKVPSSLRGTKLRKHIATHCINLNLSETQVSDLANFMGDNKKIHKEIYRTTNS